MAKDKENLASLHATKMKNQPRKGLGLGSHSTTKTAEGSGTDSKEIERLKVEVLLLHKVTANSAGQVSTQCAEVASIPKPRGEAGSKGFKLIREMKLDDTPESKQLYHAIMMVRDSIIKWSIDLSLDFRQVDPDDLSAIFKFTRKTHPYMSKARFPQNWATAKLVKHGNNSQLHNVDSDNDDEEENEDGENKQLDSGEEDE
ncbi:hypothetical protein M413DRAFT_11844 [Hebeloma cylindrosporum]|uniref:Uncharacterized protein n=1 Tax=Hebeloma cylindrosporum TaxID=76867 RepID=A0A0C3BSQ8_HEBCY|nr:hypothetical protein M413DRAFT_11844 [Hebeloma cylindrosporum h7]